MFMLLFNSYMGSDIVEQSCMQAAKGDPNLDYNFCVASLKSNPKSQNATSLEELVFISVEQSLSNATKIFVPKVLDLLKGKNIDKFKKNCLESCLELYNDSISSLNDAVKDVNSKDFEKANLDLSSALDAPSTCEDGFKEKTGAVSPLTTENNVFSQLNLIPLAFTAKLSRN